MATGGRMSIGEAALKLGISARAIRFYEQKGLMAFKRETGRETRYLTPEQFARLELILNLQRAGLELSEIKLRLPKPDSPHGLKLSAAFVEEKISELTRKRDEIDGAIERFREMLIAR